MRTRVPSIDEGRLKPGSQCVVPGRLRAADQHRRGHCFLEGFTLPASRGPPPGRRQVGRRTCARDLHRRRQAESRSSSRKSGQRVGVTQSSVYEICQSRKLLIRISPAVRIRRSGSDIPAVLRYDGEQALRPLSGVEPARTNVLGQPPGGVADLGPAAVVDRQAEDHARVPGQCIRWSGQTAQGPPAAALRGGRSSGAGRSAPSARRARPSGNDGAAASGTSSSRGGRFQFSTERQ